MKPILLFALLLSLGSCRSNKTSIQLMQSSNFDTTVDGKAVHLYTLTSGNGVTMQVTNFGCRVVSLWTPDREGRMNDIVMGYDRIDKYIHNTGERFLGATVGRYANRIGKGQFSLDGQPYQTTINNNGQMLHGGIKGFDLLVWNVDSVSNNSIHFSLVSPDGDQGFPGELTVHMTYALNTQNEFQVSYQATTTKPTVINLSHHSFFNLKGEGNGTVEDNILTINASKIIPVDSVLIPTGEIASVTNTPFDFRTGTAIGKHINDPNVQLKNGKGYDLCWVIDRKEAHDMEFNASLYEPQSGRYLEVWSDQPGLQFYSGNFFDGKSTGKYGEPLRFRESVAFESQIFPDSPNHSNFTDARLNPGETYQHTCIYKFSTK